MDPNTLTAMHQLVQKHLEPHVVDVQVGQVLITQDDQTVHDLQEIFEKHLPHPLRAAGASRHDTLASLVEHARRHRTPESVAFCDLLGREPQLVAVYNYQPAATADADRGGWRDHRATYAFPFSEQWKRWTAAAREQLSVEAFARLLEDGIGDVADPNAPVELPRLEGVRYAAPPELLALADGLSVNVQQQVAQVQRLDNGTSQLTFVEQHTNERGEPLRVPNGFVLAIPVFVGGERFAIPVRLRYRVANKAVAWQLVLHDATTAVREAITAAAAQFAEQTGLPLFYGVPEAPAQGT